MTPPKFDIVSVVACVDYQHPLQGRYEYVIYAPNDGPILTRATGYRSKAQAQRAAAKAAQPFLND